MATKKEKPKKKWWKRVLLAAPYAWNAMLSWFGLPSSAGSPPGSSPGTEQIDKPPGQPDFPKGTRIQHPVGKNLHPVEVLTGPPRGPPCERADGSPCKLGDTVCHEGILYRCQADGWQKTDEKC